MANQEVKNLRSQVTRCRLELRELRVVLRQRQVKIRQMQAQFWRDLQNQWNDARKFDKNPLQQLYDEIERALDELGPEQANYDEKEDDLDLLEYKLGKLEDRFYTTDKAFASFSSSSSSRRSRSTTPTRPEDEASWDYHYLSRVGDAKIVRERLEDLNLERSQYVDLERDRTAMGLDLYKPNVEFLESYDDVYAKIELELREIEEDLSRLRNESRSTPLTGAKPFETTDLPQNSASLPHEHESPKAPSHRDALRRKSDGDLQNVPIDTLTVRQRVNQWILESLTGSALERARHRAMLHNPNLDDDTWKSLVTDYWQPDQAAVSPPLSRRRGSKSPSSVSAQLKAFSHSTQCVSKLKEENVEVDAVDHQPDMSSPVWGTESQFPSKTPVHEHLIYESSSPRPRSPYKTKDYFDRDRDECEIYSTSPSYID